MGNTVDKGLETLKVWQRSLEFAKLVCKSVLAQLPSQEKWALTEQLRRSVQSIPANIAEGYGRYYFQESVRFCYIARGSLEETYSHLALAYKLEYLPDEMYKSLTAGIQELRRMLNGYISFLKESKRGASEPGSAVYVRESPSPYLEEIDPPETQLPVP
jgi:four helix bundle protein